MVYTTGSAEICLTYGTRPTTQCFTCTIPSSTTSGSNSGPDSPPLVAEWTSRVTSGN
ncbi:hypothetical protein DPMN_124877 [Dreissena polymorpha]|uniref:Uncharacterized protein n=1 Tax=Dreissena polymorpha TaxID=45954 RepID=A0A9D4GX65_DREPO|nr:hypothetical protein DPMN_124877 [Dreissena polymorpha]